MAKPKISRLIDLMYERLSQKNMNTYQITSLYREVKNDYKGYLLDELDGVIIEESKKEKLNKDA